jgi:dolichol-phosphate mannosyltransferase
VLRRGLKRYGDRLIEEPGFACKAEILAKLNRLGARIEEVPVDLDGSRRNGESKMRILPTFLGYWRLMIRERVARGSLPT